MHKIVIPWIKCVTPRTCHAIFYSWRQQNAIPNSLKIYICVFIFNRSCVLFFLTPFRPKEETAPESKFIRCRLFFIMIHIIILTFLLLQIKDSLVRELSVCSTSKSTTTLKPIFEVRLNL